MAYLSVIEVLEIARASQMRKAFVVTALPLEMEAVRAHLDDLGSVAGRDGTIFECGVFSELSQKWLVVVAETGAGTHPAQGVTTQGYSLFKEFDVTIMVGIGGSRKSDVPIGSVVAADKVYMPYGGKVTAEAQHSRPEVYNSDSRLIGIGRKIGRDKEWFGRIRAPLGVDPTLAGQYPVAFPPKGIIAPIASIEAVLAHPDSELERMLARSFGDACVVEMEGYGVLHAARLERTASIVVRGVSDMMHGKSPDADAILQPVAASHAAAFAIEMLVHWGNIHPVETMPVTADPPVVIPSPQPTAPLAEAKISLVLNLSVGINPENKEGIAALQKFLHELTADSAVNILDARAGSLLLFVSDPNGSLMKLGKEKLAAEFSQRMNADLLGVVTIEEYSSIADIKRMLRVASGQVIGWPTTLPDGERFTRHELDGLFSVIDGNASSTTAILGAPGSGKSAFLATLAGHYSERGRPVLAIKADLLESDIDSEAALQKQLGLSDLPSTLLSKMASFGPTLLVIDQLDALAGYLDLRTGRLNVLLNLVRRLSGDYNIHIVLSSRIFEFNHDARLKTVEAESITLELPGWSEVLAVLEAHGIDSSSWPDDAKALMRTPQTLSTYLKLLDENPSEPFRTYQEMLERLWNERVLSGPQGAANERLAIEIADTMASRESLSLPRARFSNHSAELDALKAAGILANVDISVSFAHQTLFDFALARSFANGSSSLSNYVLARQNSLFVRPKLWAGLSYLRAADVDGYHQELRAIWTADLRDHLRILLIDFLGSQQEPTDREALIVGDVLKDEKLAGKGFAAISGSFGWFRRFCSAFIAKAMSDSDVSAQRQVAVLSEAMSFAGSDVIRLIRERWSNDPKRDYLTWMVLQSAANWTQDILEIATIVVTRTEIATSIVDYQVSAIGAEQPQLALDLVLAKLNRDLSIATTRAYLTSPDGESDFDDDGGPGPGRLSNGPLKRLIEQSDEWDSLAALATQSPIAFLETLWPWFAEVFRQILIYGSEETFFGFSLFYTANFRFDDETGDLSREPALLGALRIAVEQLATHYPDDFERWVSESEKIAAAPIQRVIAHAITRNPERLAPLASKFMLGDTRRFYLGSLEDHRSTTRRLVKTLSPFWTHDQIKEFVQVVKEFAPQPRPDLGLRERKYWRDLVRRTRLDLLRALPSNRISSAESRHVEEETRRFGDAHTGVRSSGPQWIGSIVNLEEMQKASNDDIIRAFVALPDTTGFHHPNDFMKGGNVQLSRAFANFAQTDIDRASAIIHQLHPGNGTRVAGYTIQTLAEGGDTGKIFDLLRDVVKRGFDGEEFRSSVAFAVRRISLEGKTTDQDIIEMFERWLVTPPADRPQYDAIDSQTVYLDPSHVEEPDSPVPVDLEDSLLWGHGRPGRIPGGDYSIIEALILMYVANGKPSSAIDLLRSHLDHEKSFIVWDSLADYFNVLWGSDPAAIQTLVEKLLSMVPSIVASANLAQLVAHMHSSDSNWVDQIVDNWRLASDGSARQAYGEIVAVATLYDPDCAWAHQRAGAIMKDSSSINARVGLALSAANLFARGFALQPAADMLVELLQSGDDEIWPAAFEAFRHSHELSPGKATEDLLGAIAVGLEKAPRVESTFVVDRLASLLPHCAELVSRVALGLIENWKSELADIRTATAAAAPALADLAVTIHRIGPETRELGTTLFEKLIELDAYEARQTLDEIDNRFRPGRRMPRRRLRRRSEVSPSRRKSGFGPKATDPSTCS